MASRKLSNHRPEVLKAKNYFSPAYIASIKNHFAFHEGFGLHLALQDAAYFYCERSAPQSDAGSQDLLVKLRKHANDLASILDRLGPKEIVTIRDKSPFWNFREQSNQTNRLCTALNETNLSQKFTGNPSKDIPALTLMIDLRRIYTKGTGRTDKYTQFGSMYVGSKRESGRSYVDFVVLVSGILGKPIKASYVGDNFSKIEGIH